MDRNEKEVLVETLKGVFAEAGSVVMTEYSGMTVAEMTDLRAKLREQGASIRVINNRLAKIALKGTPAEGASDMLTGPVAVAWAEDMISAPKVTVSFAKDNDHFNIIGGFMGEEIFDENGILELSKLPSREELIGMVASRLLGQASQIGSRLNAVGSALVGAIKVIEEKAAA
ncbi:50S ribosomal protein L10 [Robiginitomaculum antarcticum]|uniref:50S ribosomal protein L10 n=1 Tax=Robiginitomaculum antarcticum TaxID=437507 RepID=UPI000373E605|nr:50S ribosomal protein L10 [Robiginitomaculum antarcticum]